MKDYLDTKTDIVWCRFMDRYKYMQHCDTIKKELESLRQKKTSISSAWKKMCSSYHKGIEEILSAVENIYERL